MFAKKPEKGMRDILPKDLLLREKVMKTIEDTYRLYGFSRIETPCVEDIGLLTGKNGGDNEKLIFRILKRGEKLAENDGQLCDCGLRYDLTVPLTRFYSNNSASLPSVFKAMQIGNVWRADNPQKGRFRQFVQCDIDVIGEKSAIAEIELISATTEALGNLGFSGFTVRINDRRILRAIAVYCGFKEEDFDKVYISLDKLDKIGMDGVLKELTDIGAGEECAYKLRDCVEEIRNADNPLEKAKETLADALEEGVAENLKEIFDTSRALVGNCNIVFDVTLVRGMNYYTGTIFEIAMDGLGYSVAGGGRYDKLLGKFTGKDIPACGFSIGFERIVSVLAERGDFSVEERAEAVIVPKESTAELIRRAMKLAEEKRKAGIRCTVLKKTKNFRQQLDELLREGFGTAFVMSETGEIKEMELSAK